MVSNGKRLLLIESAACSNELRVALLVNNKVVEFEQEFKEKKQLRGNIYVAYVRRVEPALQAAFIEYGKNKQGFLSFSEISVDCFNISEKEREILLEGDSSTGYSSDNNYIEEGLDLAGNNESTGGFIKEVPLHRKCKLQDVISVNQKILVQLTKEERGNKGASFTTYITLVGRYCVFMPNSLNKGGVSRRIEDSSVRKQLKDILNSINLQKRSGLIVRTAGAGKSKKEIEQDYNNLTLLWQSIQQSFSSANTPSLIYNDADVVIRSVRDFCSNNTEIVVSGTEVCEAVKKYAKNVLQGKLYPRLYKGSIPIFTYYRVEDQISQLYSNRVELPSGGYLVISLTEAFVSIDVNSGKMTGEDSIEETAYRTNMEAVPEISRQANLRGLSGLIVVDFIDMMKYQYCRAVESAIKQAFKDDKAKVQFSYINDFGLMVFSRQRIKPNIQEVSTTECLHCKGIGRVKSNELIVASILRDLQHLVSKNQSKSFDLVAHSSIITYIFNNKRDIVSRIEKEFNIRLNVSISNGLDINTFVLRQGDDVVNHRQQQYYECQVASSSSKKEADKLKGNFWLTKWFSRLLSSNN